MLPEGFERWDMKAGAFKNTCICCQKQFYSKKRAGVKFCSNTCRKRASNGHKSWNTARTCKQCGGYFSATQPFQRPDYCSNACRQAAYRKRKSAMLQPVHTFVPDALKPKETCRVCLLVKRGCINGVCDDCMLVFG